MDISITANLYELIGVKSTSTVQEIKKAYRKKALSCHPDKHPDDPRAVELFHELSRALEILTDASARAAYDKVIAAKEQAKLRVREFDAKRKKLKEDLEARENAYKRSLNSGFSGKSDEEKLQAEIERLRKEGSKQVEEEIALVKKKISEELRATREESGVDASSNRIKIKWLPKVDGSHNSAYDYETLHKLFSKYGEITALVVSSSKKGRALVEFQEKQDAETALRTEIGYTQNPLILQSLWKPVTRLPPTAEKTKRTSDDSADSPFTGRNFRKDETTRGTRYTAANTSEDPSEISDAEFERRVLKNLKEAEERKRLLRESNKGENT